MNCKKYWWAHRPRLRAVYMCCATPTEEHRQTCGQRPEHLPVLIQAEISASEPQKGHKNIRDRRTHFLDEISQKGKLSKALIVSFIVILLYNFYSLRVQFKAQ